MGFFLVLFWVFFFGRFYDENGCHNGAKIEAKMDEKVGLEPKGRNLENDRESNAKRCFFIPQPSQHRSKIDQKLRSFWKSFLTSIFGRFWCRKGSQNGAPDLDDHRGKTVLFDIVFDLVVCWSQDGRRDFLKRV